MRFKKIVIEEYSPDWALGFQQLKSLYQEHLRDLITDIQHVGSTSVAGLAAKPIIDIDLIIDNNEKLDSITEKLELLGYDRCGDLGISDREAFKARSGKVPYDGSSRNWPKHHLYVCIADSDSLRNHITFRDFLRNNPGKAEAYGNLKKRLALENPDDMELYVQSKTPFITEVLRQVGFDEASINKIRQENRIDNLKSNRK